MLVFLEESSAATLDVFNQEIDDRGVARLPLGPFVAGCISYPRLAAFDRRYGRQYAGERDEHGERVG